MSFLMLIAFLIFFTDAIGVKDEEMAVSDSRFSTLVSPAAKRVWDVFYQQKKEVFRSTFFIKLLYLTCVQAFKHIILAPLWLPSI